MGIGTVCTLSNMNKPTENAKEAGTKADIDQTKRSVKLPKSGSNECAKEQKEELEKTAEQVYW